jgi:hypothetical protein
MCGVVEKLSRDLSRLAREIESVLGAGKKRSWKEEGGMDKINHCLSMASLCGGRALEDRERRAEWLGWAQVWNELASDALGHPSEEGIANRSSDLAESKYETVE